MFKVFVRIIKERFAQKIAHLPPAQVTFLNARLGEAINEAFKETLDLIFTAEVKKEPEK